MLIVIQVKKISKRNYYFYMRGNFYLRRTLFLSFIVPDSQDSTVKIATVC